MPFVTYAQNFEDVMLRRALGGLTNGFYIDVGAHDPIADSVTKEFYSHGWCGINIEPLNHFFQKLVIDRPRDVNLKCCVGATAGMVKFFVSANPGLSTLHEEYAQRAQASGFATTQEGVTCITLSKICEQHVTGDIHFMKIDVEGAEQAALEGLDLKRYRPWIMLIEATEPNTQIPSHQSWEPILLSHGYDFVYFDGLNRFYIAHEHAELKSHFILPPNYWDGFISYHTSWAHGEIERLKQAITHLEAQNAHLQAEATLPAQLRKLIKIRRQKT